MMNESVIIYAYPHDVLIVFGSQEQKTPLELIEDIEILRILELGYDVKMVEVSGSSISIDTPKDLEKVMHFLTQLIQLKFV